MNRPGCYQTGACQSLVKVSLKRELRLYRYLPLSSNSQLRLNWVFVQPRAKKSPALHRAG